MVVIKNFIITSDTIKLYIQYFCTYLQEFDREVTPAPHGAMRP